MDDYIKREDAINEICRRGCEIERSGTLVVSMCEAKQFAVNVLEEISTADVHENVRGEWEEVKVLYKADDYFPTIDTIASMRCPNCKRYHHEIYYYGNPTEMALYCSYCGADMRGVNDE